MSEYNISIYKIYFEDCDDFYIGSTKQKLCYRMLNHRKTMKEVNRKSKLYTLMREKQGIFKYVLIATHKVSSFEEQRMREQEWVDKLKPTLNILNPYTSISYCEICNKRISVIHWKHENSEEHKWNHYEIDENLIEDIQKWRKKNEPKKEPKKEPKQPKSKPYCEICDIEDNDLKYHKKQEQHIWNYYEIDESTRYS